MIRISDILEVQDHIEGLRAVVFDMDDTLYGEKEYVKSGYQKIGKEFPEIANTTERLWAFFEDGKPAIDELLKEEGMLDENTKQKCIHIYRHQMPDIHLYTGVREMIEKLRQKGLKLGLITDGRPEGQRAKIQALGLEELFDHIIVTDELGGPEYRKPNQKAFELMGEELGIAYAEMCYVGDNIRKDFIAPLQLGMKAIYFVNQDGLYV